MTSYHLLCAGYTHTEKITLYHLSNVCRFEEHKRPFLEQGPSTEIALPMFLFFTQRGNTLPDSSKVLRA